MRKTVVAASIALFAAGCSIGGSEPSTDGTQLSSSTTQSQLSPTDDDACVAIYDELVDVRSDWRPDFSPGGQWNPDVAETMLDSGWVDERLVPRSGVAIDGSQLVTIRGDELLVVDLDEAGPIRSVPVPQHPSFDSYVAFVWVEGDRAIVVEGGRDRGQSWPGMPDLFGGYPSVSVRWVDITAGALVDERRFEGELWSVDSTGEGSVEVVTHAPFGGLVDPEQTAEEEIDQWLPAQRRRSPGGEWSEATPVANCDALVPGSRPDARSVFNFRIDHDPASPTLADEVTLISAANTPRVQPTRQTVADPTFYEEVDIVELSGGRLLAVGVYVIPEKVTFQTQFKILEGQGDDGAGRSGFLTDEPAAAQSLRYREADELVAASISYFSQTEPQRLEFVLLDVGGLEPPRVRATIQHDPFWSCDSGDRQLVSTLEDGPLGTNCVQRAGTALDIRIDDDRIITVTSNEVRVHDLTTRDLVSVTSFLRP